MTNKELKSKLRKLHNRLNRKSDRAEIHAMQHEGGSYERAGLIGVSEAYNLAAKDVLSIFKKELK